MLTLSHAMPLDKDISIDVMDINGRIVNRQKILGNDNYVFTIPVDIGAVSAGLYFVKLTHDNYTETLKFIKQ